MGRESSCTRVALSVCLGCERKGATNTIVNRFGVPPQFDQPPSRCESESLPQASYPPPERKRLPTVIRPIVQVDDSDSEGDSVPSR